MLNVGNGWVAGGCWDYYSIVIVDHSRKFPTFSTSKLMLWPLGMGKYGEWNGMG